MNRKCPTCGRQLDPVGECLACGGSNEKKTGLVEALWIRSSNIGISLLNWNRIIPEPIWKDPAPTITKRILQMP